MNFTLPKPPSINHIYGFTSRGGYARSYITQKGTAWFTEAGYLVNTQRNNHITFTEHLQISIKLYTARRQDVDNIVKPIMDLFQKKGVIENDTLIYRLIVEKIRCKVPEERVEITIEKYPEK